MVREGQTYLGGGANFFHARMRGAKIFGGEAKIFFGSSPLFLKIGAPLEFFHATPLTIADDI